MAKKVKSKSAASSPVKVQAEQTEHEKGDVHTDRKEESSSASKALISETVMEEGEPVQVNNASLIDLKHACDDFIKEHFSRPDAFKPSYTHDDIHLALGWSNVIIAGAMSLYAWYIPFKDSKKWVIVGVVLYSLLSSIQWIHQKYFVKDTVFRGKRKTFSGRIETQTIAISTRTLPKPVADPPLLVSLRYSHSANNGKSVLSSAEGNVSLSFGEVFDDQGFLHKSILRGILTNLEKDVLDVAA